MIDPRISIIEERMKGIRRVIVVSSGKGGVGKSLLASILALILVKKGYNVGLLDLDFTSPSTHLILGIRNVQPEEDKGVVPPFVHGLKYMSIIYYSAGKVTPLRGADVSNALIELLSVTKWGKLDYLIIDMPPGIGDAMLDIIRFIKKLSFLVVTTPSQLAFETVRKLIGLLNELKVPVAGIVENMKMNNSGNIRSQFNELGIRLLGEIPYDPKMEKAIGDVDKLLNTVFAEKVGGLIQALIS